MSRNVKIEQLANNIEVLLSYGVRVAAFVPGMGYIRRDDGFSVTTTKHMTQYCQRGGTKGNVVTREAFFAAIGDAR